MDAISVYQITENHLATFTYSRTKWQTAISDKDPVSLFSLESLINQEGVKRNKIGSHSFHRQLIPTIKWPENWAMCLAGHQLISNVQLRFGTEDYVYEYLGVSFCSNFKFYHRATRMA